MNDVLLTTIKIEGLRELEMKLAALPAKLERNILAQAMAAGARVIQKEVKQNAPVSIAPHILKSYSSKLFKKFNSEKIGVWVLPGNLRKMIRIKIDKSKSRGYAVTYEVYVKNKEAWYWKFVEFGTSKMQPKPFMRNGFESAKLAAISEIEKQIKARIEF